jgi:iron-sulfur cluster repair protein YtfE (RIC family)
MMKITKDSTVEEVVLRYPDAVDIFFKYGIPAIACGTPIWGTIGENAERYNVSDLEGLLRELNELAERMGAIDVKISLEGN